MHRFFAPALAGLALCCAALHADPTSDARRAIQLAYDKMNAAAARRDAVGAFAYRTPDAVSVEEDGSVTPIAKERADIKCLFAATKSVKAVSVIQSLSLSGSGTATVSVKEHMAAVMVSPDGRQKMVFVVDDTARDFWVKTGKGWRQKRSQDTSHSMTVNGRPVSQGVNPSAT